MEGIETGKKEVKLLFADGLIVYIKNSNKSIKQTTSTNK